MLTCSIKSNEIMILVMFNEDLEIYLGNPHRKLPFCTQLLFLILVLALCQQLCLLLHLGSHLFSLSQPT